MNEFFAISVDRATPDQLNRINELVKLHSPGWWHHHAAFWIVNGKDPRYWRDLVKTILSGTQARVLVLRLPSSENGRWWASYGEPTEQKSGWLKKYYSKRDLKKKIEPDSGKL